MADDQRNLSALKFRKRPVEVEAMEYDGSAASQRAIVAWTNGVAVQMGGVPHNLVIRTLEGNHLASPGDWIIRGVAGEFYPCKPDIFARTYEAVDE